ncbi:MAG TPA: hypothetical protein DCL61_02915 [Cyanobacteria bacterium UBA12227]|nr:hypothetical protein [Cyanobacteria bacterium UBA12227]HAX86743.1 hypothetical protein [Cyanobacteria bacterium UBA11370]
MQAYFLPNDSELPSTEVSIQASTDPVSGKEFIKVMVIGSRKGISSIIKTLHRLRFADVREWSPLIPYGASGEMMSLLRRQIILD